MKTIKKVIMVAGISVMLIVGCKEKEQVMETGKSTEVSKGTEVFDEEWIELWPEENMEVNFGARRGLIDSIAKPEDNLFLATEYDYKKGELITEKVYCFFFSLYFNKNQQGNDHLSFPENLEDVSAELWDKEMSAWKINLGALNGPSLDRGSLEIEILSKEVVKLSGKKFLREEIIGKAAFMGTGEPQSSRFIAYYYQNEGGQGVCVFGDRSEEQTDANYENIQEAAAAIMSTFRE